METAESIELFYAELLKFADLSARNQDSKIGRFMAKQKAVDLDMGHMFSLFWNGEPESPVYLVNIGAEEDKKSFVHPLSTPPFHFEEEDVGIAVRVVNDGVREVFVTDYANRPVVIRTIFKNRGMIHYFDVSGEIIYFFEFCNL